MTIPLRILILEDDPSDAELEIAMLERAGYACQWQRIETEAEFLTCLKTSTYDLVLADYNLPAFDGLTALKLFLTHQLDLPFILVSGKVSEEITIESLRAGATDYVLKSHLARLGPVVSRALQEKAEQQQRRQAEASLRQSEERFRQVVSSISDHIYVTEITAEGAQRNLYLSPHVEALTGYPLEKFAADWSFWPVQVIHPDDQALAAAQFAELAQGRASEAEYRLIRADGSVIWVRDSARVESSSSTARIIYGLVSNITGRKQAEEEIRQLNEDLERRVLDRTRELSALYEVSSVASEALDLDTTLQRSLERVLSAMRSNFGLIHLLAETDHIPALAIQQGLSPEVILQVERTGLFSQIIQDGEVLVIPNLSGDLRTSEVAHLCHLSSYVGVPMRAGGRILGVLSVFGTTGQQFNMEEVALLASIADQVGVVVENARLRQRAKRAAVIEERERLARELHDSVTQSLYSLTLFAEAGRELTKGNDLSAIDCNFAQIGETSHHALKEMRLLVHELRPLDLQREGLVMALHRRLSAVEGRVNVKARLVAEELLELPAAVEEELYRIIQEALNNALKHAAAKSVIIYLRVVDEQVEVEIVDDGVGFRFEAISHNGGMGLISMRERAEKLGGKLIIDSTPDRGTKIKVRVKVGEIGA